MIEIPRAVRDELVRHAYEALPNECCGLLLGEGSRIDEAVRTPNLRASPSAYLIDPAAHFASLRRVRAEGRQIVGAYHSHTHSPAVPSASDMRESHYPEFVHVIVSLEGDPAQLRAYAIGADNYEELPLLVT
ncbi:MAG TPA: M67 family metallopeptidase [Sphingomicrobium sp.]|nr:M67 family metallopeptidase [Sphingomicrobium sp.]